MTYERRSPEDGGEVEQVSAGKGASSSKFRLENSWVVPYSLDLLQKFRTHMNVEICISRVGSVKYLFKYVCKSSDRGSVEIKIIQWNNGSHETSKKLPTIDEMQQYQDALYISASKAAWRLSFFPIVEHKPL